MTTGPITLAVALWPVADEEEALHAYETAVLDLLPAHGATLTLRTQSIEPGADGPCEVQIIDLPSEDALASYLQDPRRLALNETRSRCIARTEILRVERID